MGRRQIDTPDTVDTAIGTLMRLQADGWGIEHTSVDISYGRPSKKAPKIPVAATVTVRLRPAVNE